MVTMKLFLLLLFIAVVAPHSFAFSESSKDWASPYESTEFAFFDGDISATETEDSRRLLFQYGYTYKYPSNKYLSYAALRKNNIPCGRRGSSYYDCNKRMKTNPYRRGCFAITGCARFTD